MSNYPNSIKRKILVVEDELINREVLKMILQEEYEVLFAQDGNTALDQLKEHHEDLSLVLLDLNLPDIHGFEVLRVINEDPSYKKIPVIVMTADKDAEVESLQIGAIDFIPKPYPQPKIILARVRRIIELYEDKEVINDTRTEKLTGLYNREYFYRYVKQYDQFYPEVKTDAIVIDINHFHILNERYGKSFGNEVLIRISEILKEYFKDTDAILSRTEGDFFMICTPHMEDHDKFYRYLLNELGFDKNVRLRMGVYPNADKNIDAERRFDRAKSAADSVKNTYTDHPAFYDDEIHDRELYMEQLLEGFDEAINKKQFLICYQPKFYVREEQPLLSSAEALVRWKHPELGMISPGVFIPLFEENGLIRKLDAYIWEEVVRQISIWKQKLGIILPISVNVSRVDLYDPGFVSGMEDLVKQYGLDPKDLILEITESAYTENADELIRTIKELREKGFRIEMDDFGSGYSSLNMLSVLEFDALKLDMLFIHNAFRQRKDTRLLEIVMQLSETLHVPVIAEGVETAEQMYTLKMMDCDYIQGYYFSNPLSAQEFEQYLQKVNRCELSFEKGKKRYSPSYQTAYDALHDPLTGLYNHSAFEILFHDADKDHIAVMIADIDDYDDLSKEKKQEAAISVSDVLKHSFRNVDHICRLKADEFVIIMTRFNKENKDLVIDKIEGIEEELSNKDISLSVGAALSDDVIEHDIFEAADIALNNAKKDKKKYYIV